MISYSASLQYMKTEKLNIFGAKTFWQAAAALLAEQSGLINARWHDLSLM
jgi:hypothetical protein